MNPANERMLTHFAFDHLPPHVQNVSRPIAELARTLAEQLDTSDPTAGTEVTTGLRKLLEAKDCLERAARRLR